MFDKPDAPKDQRPHDDFADLGRPYHQGPKMRGIERERRTSFVACVSRGYRGTAGKLIDLSGELPRAMDGDRRHTIETVTARHLDLAIENEPGRHAALADRIDGLTGCKAMLRTAGETPRKLDLRTAQNGKHLGRAGIGVGHDHLPGWGRAAPRAAPSCQAHSVMKASRSGLMTSAWVVSMPCGKPGYIFSVPFCNNLT